jgi:hypothetical protein
MNIEVMKLALEALQWFTAAEPWDEPDVSKAIKALEEALAKQEQGEPVALETVYETIIHWDEGGGKRSRRELARRIVAIYTTPQPKQEQGEPYTIHTLHCVCGKTWQMDVCPTKIKE